MGEFFRKFHQRPINSKYSLVRKIARGGHGAVYLGRDLDSGQEVALKLEYIGEEWLLRFEALYYEHLRDSVGFPKMYWYGSHDYYNIMAMELLGPSLEDLLLWCGNRFSLKTTLMLADQLFERLEVLHKKRYVHRDFKPQNCMLGTGENGTLVYIADLGLAEEFNDAETKVSEDAPRGTLDFASIREHTGQGCSPADDVESLLYTLVYFLKGKLPWDDIKEGNQFARARLVLKMKREMTMEKLCSNLPQTFVDSMVEIEAHVRSLSRCQLPDYNTLRQSLRKVAEAECIEYDNVYDWIVLWFERHGEL